MAAMATTVSTAVLRTVPLLAGFQEDDLRMLTGVAGVKKAGYKAT